MTSTDTPAIDAAANEVRRFIVENQPVRGYWVDLEALAGAARPSALPARRAGPARRGRQRLVLLAATLKFEGTLTLQLEGKGRPAARRAVLA